VTKFVVDCGVVLRLAEEGIEVPAEPTATIDALRAA
jgi:hypothetical protein